MTPPSEEPAAHEAPPTPTGDVVVPSGVKVSATTGTAPCSQESTKTAAEHVNRGPGRSSPRPSQRRSRQQRRKRTTSSGNESTLEVAPSGHERSQNQKHADVELTGKPVSVVQKALSDPDSLTPLEVDRLVSVVFRKAIHEDDTAEPAAKFCATVITAGQDGEFIDCLLCTCRNWFRQHDLPSRQSATAAPEELPPDKDKVYQWTAFVSFLATLLEAIPGKGTALLVGSCHSGHAFCMAALLCESCKFIVRSPDLDFDTKVECLHSALMKAGQTADRGAPARMKTLVACLRDALLTLDMSEDNHLMLLELVELRASGWKWSPQQERYYSARNDTAGDDCYDAPHRSPLPCRTTE